MVDKEEVTLIVYDIWEQVRTKMCLTLQGLGKSSLAEAAGITHPGSNHG
jgi:hypothetical protein